MNILLIDTSSNYCSVSLKVNRNIFTKTKYMPRQHNKYLIDIVDAIISKAKITKYNIHLLAYGMGPGSFTGIRLSAALMHGISFVTKKPVLGFSSMCALAKVVYQKFMVPLVTIILSARIGDTYLGQYQFDLSNNSFIVITEQCITIKKLTGYLSTNTTGLIVGDSIRGLDFSFVKITDYFPDSQYMFEIVEKNYQILKSQGKVIQNAMPMYLQGTKKWQK